MSKLNPKRVGSAGDSVSPSRVSSSSDAVATSKATEPNLAGSTSPKRSSKHRRRKLVMASPTKSTASSNSSAVTNKGWIYLL